MRRILPLVFCGALACSGDLARDLHFLTLEQMETCFDRAKFVRPANRDEVLRQCVATARHRNEVLQ